MAEYIDRKAAMSAVLSDVPDAHYPEWYAAILAKVPVADVAPMVHGRWVHHDDGVVTCSECGNAESSEGRYCSYCGAKMDL